MNDRGFRDVTRLAAATERLLSVVDRVRRTATVPVVDADGRVLADSLDAERDVPGYDRAAMDGYAVRATDTHGATDRSPTRLDVVGGTVGRGAARYVHTGSPVPDGANAVVKVEATEERGESVDVGDAVAPGTNVAPAGEDVTAGERIFDAGHRLTPSDLGLVKASGHAEVPVLAKPRVSVVPTGEELVQSDPDRGETVETNGLTVSRLVERWGGDATYHDVVDDDEDALGTAIEGAAADDLVVTTGGSSVGERDLVPDVVADRGEMLVHGVALKPGHPVGFGVVDETPVVTLPGYPVSCLVTAVQLVRPAVAAAGGFEPSPFPVRSGTLDGKIASEPGVRSFVRVRFTDGDTVEPVRTGGAGVLSSVARADGWVVVPESVEGIPDGEAVTVQLLETLP